MNYLVDNNRATGRTTRMLHKVVAELISQDNKKRAIKVVAYKQTYAEALCRKVRDVLSAYGCLNIVVCTKSRIIGKYCDVEFLGQDSVKLKEYSNMRGYTFMYDHFTGGY